MAQSGTLAFESTIGDMIYVANLPVNLTLPPATGGIDPLTYTLTPDTDIPRGLTFDPGTRTFAGTPTEGAAVDLTYTVTDSAVTPSSVALTFMITVIDYPVITITDSIMVGRPATRYTDIANIVDGDVTFTFVFSEVVSGFIADDITVTGGTKGTFNDFSHDKIYTLVVTPYAGMTSGTITVEVEEGEATGTITGKTTVETTATQEYDTLAPAVPTIGMVTGDDTINIDEQTTTLTGTTEAGTIVTLCFGGADDACTGGITAGVEATTTTWSYTLDATDIAAMGQGDETLRATATDAAGNTAQATPRDISVDTIAPVFISGTKGVVIAGPESIATAYDADATDNGGVKDVGITYALSGDDTDEFNLVAETGVVNYQRVQNDIVMHDIVITATDTAGNAVTQAVEISTATFTITALADQNIAENMAYTSAIPSITGTFAGTLTWSLDGVDAGVFTINLDNGKVSLVAQDFENPQDTGTDNTYRFTLTATNTDNSIVTSVTSAVTTITITDANVIGTGLTLTPTALTVAEGTTTHTYTAVLAAAPPGPVVVSINQDGEVTTTPVALTFTATDWNAAQTVTLTAAQDDDATTEDTTLRHTASGGEYDSVTADLVVTVTDDDTVGLTLTPTSLTVDEGSTFTYTVVLNTQPTDTVAVRIYEEGRLPLLGTLTFMTATWNTEQTVTLLAIEDEDVITEDVTLTHFASGGDYDEVTATLLITVTDNDLRFDTPIADQVYLAGTDTITLTLPEASGGVGALNYDLKPEQSIPDGLAFTFDATTRILAVTPTTATATTPLTYTVMDSAASPLPATLTFSVTVVAVTLPDGGQAEANETSEAIAVNNVGDPKNDLLLFLPVLTEATTFTVGTYDPLAEGTPAPAGVIFSGVAMDIAIPSAPGGGTTADLLGGQDATVCLSHEDVPEGRIPTAAIYHFDGTAWEAIRTTPTTPTGFACGDTDTFSPFAVGYTMAGNDPRLDTVIADQVYLAGTAITPLTLPTATGGTGMLTYTLVPDTAIPDGLIFDADARTLAGTPTTASATTPLTYTVTDSTASPLPATLTFSVTVVAVTLPGGGQAVADETGKTIAVNNVGGMSNNDLLLFLPALTEATTFTVDTYDPLAQGTPAPARVTFSGVTMDIVIIGTLAGDDSATVCLSTNGVPGGREAVLYHYIENDWNPIVSAITKRDGFVCGTTDTFSPFAVGFEGAGITETIARLNEQILTRASQAMTASTLEAVARRVEAGAGGAASSAGGAGTAPALAYQFGGQSSLSGLLKSHGKAMLEDQMEYEQLFDSASFVVPLSAAEGGTGGGKSGGGVLSLWGSSDFINLDSDNDGLDSDNDGLDWDGQVVSINVGVDGLIGKEMLAGFALSSNQSSFDYVDSVNEAKGEYNYSSTILHPYIGWFPGEDLKLWASVGFGSGEIEINIDTEVKEYSTNTTQQSLSGGFSRRLLNPTKQTSGNTITLNLKGDVSMTSVDVEENLEAGFAAQEVSSSRLRVLISGEQQCELASGGGLTPSLEMGVRYDGGDGVTGTGVELGGGLRYANSGGNVAVSGNVRTLLAHDYNESGADFLLQLLPSAGRGLSLSLHPVWGKTQSVAEQLWNDGASEITGGDTALGGSVDTEVGYGMAATMLGSPGLLTPYIGVTATDDGANRLRFGGRFAGRRGLSLNLEGVRGNTADGASHQVLLRGEVGF